MDYREFLEALRTCISERLGEAYTVNLFPVTRNNAVKMDSISILGTGENICPAIYLNPYYEEFRDGASVPEIAEEVIRFYYSARPNGNFDVSFYRDPDKVRDRIVYRLINYAKNEELLREVPHRRFLDLAIVYYCLLEDKRLGSGAVLVRRQHMDSWGMSEEELDRAAAKNTARMLPCAFMTMGEMLEILTGVGEDMGTGAGVLCESAPTIQPAGLLRESGTETAWESGAVAPWDAIDDGAEMSNLLRESGSEQVWDAPWAADATAQPAGLLRESGPEAPWDAWAAAQAEKERRQCEEREHPLEAPLYVLTNESRNYGAYWMSDAKVLAAIGEKLGDDYYILPSSVHECMVVPAVEQWDVENLHEMVCEINETQVMPEEVLADSVYRFSRTDGQLRQCA